MSLTGDFEKILDDYKVSNQNNNYGGILMTPCRRRMSEGVNFIDDARAIPLPKRTLSM